MYTTKPFTVFLTIVVCCGLAACGGDNPAAPTPTSALPTPPPAPVSTVVAQGSLAGIPVNAGYFTPAFTTSSVGRLDATLDWTFARCDLDLYVLPASASCTADQFNARQCQFVAFSESTTAKPEKISVASLPAGAYKLLITNWGPVEESFSYQAVLTTGGSASSFAAPAGQPSKTGVLRFITG